jgi:hypothetical protein
MCAAFVSAQLLHFSHTIKIDVVADCRQNTISYNKYSLQYDIKLQNYNIYMLCPDI